MEQKMNEVREENFGGIYQSLIDNVILLHVANVGRARMLIPLNFPKEEMRLSYGFASYKRLADSLEDHIKNAINAVSSQESKYTFDHWVKYIESISEKVESDIDSYEPEWEEGKKKFYRYIFARACKYIKESPEYRDITFMRISLQSFIQEVNLSLYESHLNEHLNKMNDYQAFLKFEFVTKTALFITERLEKDHLYENLN